MTHQGAVGKGPRYAVYDFEYSLASGDGLRFVAAEPRRDVLGTMLIDSRNKITFIAWSPDDAGVMVCIPSHILLVYLPSCYAQPPS